jgi:hypothetical protein
MIRMFDASTRLDNIEWEDIRLEEIEENPTKKKMVVDQDQHPIKPYSILLENILRIASGSVHIFANNIALYTNSSSSRCILFVLPAVLLLLSEWFAYYGGDTDLVRWTIVSVGAICIGVAQFILSKDLYQEFMMDIKAVLAGSLWIIGGLFLTFGYGHIAYSIIQRPFETKLHRTILFTSKVLSTIGSIVYMVAGICLISALSYWPIELITISAAFFILGGLMGFVVSIASILGKIKKRSSIMDDPECASTI